MDPKWLTIRPSTIHMTPAEYSPTERSTHTEEAFFISVKLREKGRIKPQICEKETEWYPLCWQIPPNNPGALNTPRSICAFQEPRVIIDRLHTHITKYTKIAFCLVCLISALHGYLLIDTVYTIKSPPPVGFIVERNITATVNSFAVS